MECVGRKEGRKIRKGTRDRWIRRQVRQRKKTNVTWMAKDRRNVIENERKGGKLYGKGRTKGKFLQRKENTGETKDKADNGDKQ